MFRSENKSEQLVAVFLVVVGILMRLVPHPYNFTPVTAIALFAGAALSTRIAFTLPLIIMIISDLIIGPHPLFWLTWGCFSLVTCLGWAFSKSATVAKICLATLSGSVIFFVVTNLEIGRAHV
jgi:hypothetical protein